MRAEADRAARKAVRATRRIVLAKKKGEWRRRFGRWGITDPEKQVGIRAGHPAHDCGLCATRPRQRQQPDWRNEAEVEIAEQVGTRTLPDLGRQKRSVITRRDGHRRWK